MSKKRPSRTTRQGIPIYADQSEPEIDDPAHTSLSHHWYPANSISTKLVICLEAIRDVETLLRILAGQESPTSTKRVIKLLATPLFNLASGVRDIFNDLEGNAREYGQLKDNERKEIKTRFNQFSKQVPLDAGSALKTVRDKISSHIDKEVFRGDARRIWKLVDLESQLEWMKATIDALMFLLKLDIYAWTRESGNRDIFRLMSADGVQVDLNLKKKLIVGLMFARSPKYYIAQKIQEIGALYATLKANKI